MWIRSQNKEVISCANEIWYSDAILIREGNFILCESNGSKSKIGEYSTKEKALKVLDMIQEYINEETYTSELTNEFVHYGKGVFQMPQDDEVIVDG